MFGFPGFWLLCLDFLWFQRAGATLQLQRAGFSCGARALGAQAPVVATHGLRSHDIRA